MDESDESSQSSIIRRGAVAVICDGDKVLIIRRSQHVVAPGAYCFPGGGIEPGESETEALIRELREELGIEAVPHRHLWSSVTPWQVELAWWLVRLSPDSILVPSPVEVESVHWHTLEEIAALPELLESNRQFLAALARGEFALDNEEHRRSRLLDQSNTAYAALRRDEGAWQEELEERAAWDATLTDGLDDP